MTYSRLFTPVLALVVAGFTYGQEPIRFARTPDISPDGKLVAFSYLGDIWIVETIGGVARPVTMHEAHDINPVFSPDGRQLAFTSNRHGSTTSSSRRPTAASRGGSPSTPPTTSCPRLDARRQERPVLLHAEHQLPGRTGAVHGPGRGRPGDRSCRSRRPRTRRSRPTGDAVAYVRGPGTWYRKGYRGSSNDDLWLANADGIERPPR